MGKRNRAVFGGRRERMISAKRDADVTVENYGSVMLFRPHTDEAREWLEENVQSDGWQWLGRALAVEPRYARDLADGLAVNGFKVE